jgi:hypothetical protein
MSVDVAFDGVVPNADGEKSNPIPDPVVLMQVPLIAKQPAAMLKPFAPVVVPTVVSEPTVVEPNVPAFAKKFVDDAVVAKKAVAVALPRIIGCES